MSDSFKAEDAAIGDAIVPNDSKLLLMEGKGNLVWKNEKEKTLVCPSCGAILVTLTEPAIISLPEGTTISCHKCDGGDIAVFKDGWFEWIQEWPKFEQDCVKINFIHKDVL